MPPLRIAHGIRDLAYGDQSGAEEVLAMVKSEDRAYHAIFERCCWVDVPEKDTVHSPESKKTARKTSSRKDRFTLS